MTGRDDRTPSSRGSERGGRTEPATNERSFTVGADEAGETLASLARRHALCATWSEARRLVSGGKLTVNGRAITEDVFRPRVGALVTFRPRARRVEPAPPGQIVFDDSQVVVFDKPAGISSVPYEERESGTAMDLIRAHWRRAGLLATDIPIHIVHRIDKETSGLIMFAKSKAAERALQNRFRAHDIERTYLCVVHGHLTDRRIESRLVEDRRDGLRGSTRNPQMGKKAITQVRAIREIGPHAMLCEVRLETGKTHQIRIHLAENGHPLVGERVYIRDWVRDGKEPLRSTRLLLHAATLGFEHPTTAETLKFESPLPAEFERAMAALGRID